ncbi:MAG TPA: hypothetical protein P5048_04795 [Chlamydiales bacterium]|nr:hypothetical protein [Chlamydiales bacterium]
MQKRAITVQQLASTHVNTPDYRQKDYPSGEKIVVSWDYPLSDFQKGLTMFLTVRFMNHEQKTFSYPLKRKRGIHAFYFYNSPDEEDQDILTYKIEVKTDQGVVLDVWKQQLWTELIELSDD